MRGPGKCKAVPSTARSNSTRPIMFEVSTWARWANPHLLQHKRVQSLVSEVPNLRKPSRIKTSRLFAPQVDTQDSHTSQNWQDTYIWTLKVTKSLFLTTSKIEWLVCFSWAGIMSSWQAKRLSALPHLQARQHQQWSQASTVQYPLSLLPKAPLKLKLHLTEISV